MGSGKSIVKDKNVNESANGQIDLNELLENTNKLESVHEEIVEIIPEQNPSFFNNNICLNKEEKPKQNVKAVKFLKVHTHNSKTERITLREQPKKVENSQARQNDDIADLEEIDLLESINNGQNMPQIEPPKKQDHLKEIKINKIQEKEMFIPRKLPPLQPGHAIRILHKEKENNEDSKINFASAGNLHGNQKIIQITPSSSRRLPFKSNLKSSS